MTLKHSLLIAAAMIATVPTVAGAQPIDPKVQARIDRILKATPLIDGHNDIAEQLAENYKRDITGLASGTNQRQPHPLMTDMAKNAGLPWDCVLGAELVRHYKPDAEVYRSAADFLDLPPADVMMVAAHLGDLRAAKAVGLKTAFVARPLEYGPAGKPDLKADGSVDVSAADFNGLAAQLGA